MQERGVRNIERIFDGRVQRGFGFDHAHDSRVLRTGAGQRKRLRIGLGVELRVNPNEAVLLAHGGGWGAAFFALAAEQSGDMDAAPRTLELPTVVSALESPTCDYTAERQRHVAM